MATSSPWLVFGAACGITAEDLMFSTHLGSANMALQSATPLLAPRCSHNLLFWVFSFFLDTMAGTRATGI